MGIVERSEELPQEWLLSLQEDHGLYRQLLEECESLALAAHAVARARCRVRGLPTATPNVAELGAAAQEVATKADSQAPLPRPLHLADECEAAGRPVIGSRRAA